ncbi:hypothetical protein GALMADRAFT_229002 [Galerina marginata CBS 339.88]|uniref:DUF6533 domain-containing protein n=1 Tax=Galerina marginata (strain CBS 339.88) TaxID=685588 RepID=A0A067SYG1_GALM3|nr:hypothetical protein GALMADRAFT_229002 [Galerina marginata CBS 339.88]
MAGDVTLEDLMGMNVNYYFTLVSFTLLVHEYCITFVAEVERFWSVGRLNWASGFFYLNRYLTLFGHIPVVMEFFWANSNPHKIQICHQLQSFHQYLAIVIQLVVACMMIMRMYALYERSRKVLALHIGVAVAAVAIGCWSVLGGKSEKSPDVLVPVGCGATLTHNQLFSWSDSGLGAAWGGMLVFDALVFGMTLYKSLSIPRTREINLLTVLLRDGKLFPFTRGVATMSTNIVSSIMISRLMLNLRHPSLAPHQKRSYLTTTEEATYPNLTFIEPQYDTEYSDAGGIISQPARGRSHSVYDYLAKGSSRKTDDSHEMKLLERDRYPV